MCVFSSFSSKLFFASLILVIVYVIVISTQSIPSQSTTFVSDTPVLPDIYTTDNSSDPRTNDSASDISSDLILSPIAPTKSASPSSIAQHSLTIEENSDYTRTTTNIPNTKDAYDKDDYITYMIDTIPHYALQPDLLKSSVHKAFDSWSDLNPQLKFSETYADPVIAISWERYSLDDDIAGEYLGGNYGDANGGGTITIMMGDLDCNGNLAQWNAESIHNTMTHEIGHFLGLAHSFDENHLMYGTNNPKPTAYFDNLGYVLPDNIDINGFMGQRLLDEKIDNIEARIELLSIELDNKRKNNLDSYNYKVHDLFNSYTGWFEKYLYYLSTDDDGFTTLQSIHDQVTADSYSERDTIIDLISQYNSMIDEFNNNNNEYYREYMSEWNQLDSKFKDTKEQFNCYYNVEP